MGLYKDTYVGVILKIELGKIKKREDKYGCVNKDCRHFEQDTSIGINFCPICGTKLDKFTKVEVDNVYWDDIIDYIMDGDEDDLCNYGVGNYEYLFPNREFKNCKHDLDDESFHIKSKMIDETIKLFKEKYEENLKKAIEDSILRSYEIYYGVLVYYN